MRAIYRLPLRRFACSSYLAPARLGLSTAHIARTAFAVQRPLLRHASTTPVPPQPLPHRPAPHRNPDEPVYELTFTCKACRHRSAHTVSKQGYHKGTVLITCPGCKNKHLISDHLRIFSDTAVTLEDILSKRGEVLQKGAVDSQGDVEFWPSASDTKKS